MRIMLISGSFPTMKCGVGDYTFMLAKHLANTGMQIGVLTHEMASLDELINFDLFPILEDWDFKHFKKIKNTLEQWRPDVVHIQYPTRGYGRKMAPSFLPLILRSWGYKTVQTWHEPLSKKGLLRYLPNTLGRDNLIVVEPDYSSFLPKWYNRLIGSKQMNYIPIGSNIPKMILTEEEKEEIRSEYGVHSTKSGLIGYFGFAVGSKGIEKIFEIVDKNKDDHVVLLCDLSREDDYQRVILDTISQQPWKGKVTVTGFLDKDKVAKVLAACDAVILPFVDGVSFRNGSFLAARIQGTFVLTTHKERNGYNEQENVYYSQPEDIMSMRSALYKYMGKHAPSGNKSEMDWITIAQKHIQVYASIIK